MSEAERTILAEELGELLVRLERLETSMRSVDQQIEERITQHPEGGKLLEMPGIGPFVAAVLVAELLPLARHGTEAQAATYSGVTPLCRSSGRQERSHLGRRTNKRILRALYLSAVASTRVSALDRDYYQRKREQFQGHPKPHVKATLALARQRSKVIYRLLTTEARYEKETLIRSHLERRRAA